MTEKNVGDPAPAPTGTPPVSLPTDVYTLSVQAVYSAQDSVDGAVAAQLLTSQALVSANAADQAAQSVLSQANASLASALATMTSVASQSFGPGVPTLTT